MKVENKEKQRKRVFFYCISNDAMPPTKFVIIAMIPMIELAPHDKPVPSSEPVNELIPRATPMIPTIKQTNARAFPTQSTIDLIRSDNANETSKHMTEKIENKHANVTKALAAVTLLQAEDDSDVPKQLHATHCVVDNAFMQVFHNP